jgi:hypothetical protein
MGSNQSGNVIYWHLAWKCAVKEPESHPLLLTSVLAVALILALETNGEELAQTHAWSHHAA